MSLTTLFNPRSVAVIGACNEPQKVGYALMKNILAGSPREVYPITLGEVEVLGHAAYPTVSMVAGSINCAIIAVRADLVPKILTECADKGVESAVIISAGFKEMSEEGAAHEREVARIAHERKITLVGPNCLGVMNTHAGWNATFAVGAPRTGHLAFVSQSGALGTAILDQANAEGVGFSKFISLGNEAALTELECLAYLADDSDTAAVLLYLEQVADGPRFLEAATALTRTKPLVVLRAGRSSRGAAAVASHTGSLAPSDAVFTAALRQAGAVIVDSTRAFFSVAKLLTLGITTPRTRLAVLTNGGGPSVNTADLIDLSGTLTLAPFTDATKAALRTGLPSMAAVGNPIDVIGDAGPDRYAHALDTLAGLDTVDAVLGLVTPQMMTDPEGIANTFATYRGRKPIIPVFMGGGAVTGGIRTLHEHGMVNFNAPSDAVEALAALAASVPISLRTTPLEPTSATTAPHASLSMLPFTEMQELLAAYHIPLAGVLAEERDDLPRATRELGDGPYALKVVSPELVHKSDVGALRLNLAAHELSEAWDTLLAHVHEHAPEATCTGMLLQRMTGGVECIVGMKRDRIFGPVVVFGLGGIFVETLKDVSMRIAPVSEAEALAQILEIKGLPLLMGARGREPVALEILAATIAALSRLALEHPEIEEADLNPVLASPSGATIVDARLMVR